MSEVIRADMNGIQKFGLITQRLAADCGLHLSFISGSPEGPSSTLDTTLTPGEREEGQLKTAPAAHRSWLLGRLAAKDALAALWGCAPAEVEVLKAPEGAPRAGSLGRARPVAWVSISHTVGAALAAAAEFPVGVDLERLDRPVSPRVWRWAFSPAEHEFLRCDGRGFPVNSTEREILRGASQDLPAGLALWCAKEAAAKAWGRGLLNHLDEVRITGADWRTGRVTVGWESGGVPTAEVRFMTHEGYLAALARVTDT